MNIQNKFSEIWSFLKYQWFEKRIDELNEQNKTCILNHYAYEDGDYKYDSNHRRISLSKLLKKIWLKRERTYIFENKEPIRIICHSIFMFDMLEYILEQGFTIEIVSNDCLFSNVCKNKLEYLKLRYADKLKIYVYKKFNDCEYNKFDNSMQIGRNIIFENKHILNYNNIYDSTYDTFELFEHMTKKYMDGYYKIYENYKSNSIEIVSDFSVYYVFEHENIDEFEYENYIVKLKNIFNYDENFVFLDMRNRIIYDAYKLFIQEHNITCDDIQKFLFRRTYLVSKMSSSKHTDNVYNQPIMFLMYYLIKNHECYVESLWPYPPSELCNLYSDLGISSNWP